ncbi:MAG: EAL domain-containing protein [Desulfobacteraceae bacterium]|nr:EAL domain-containing protein [Desulfobacteraceae bacterium]
MSDSVQPPQIDAAMAQEMFRLIPYGVIVINEDQTIVYLNPAAERMFKTRAENLQDRPLDVLIPREVVETHRAKIQSFLKSEETVRWLPYHRDPVSPEEFIPLLEDMEMIKEVGEFVLRSACATCLRMQEAGLEMPRIAVNISALQLQEPDFVDKITEILQSAGLAPQRLELEITESILITHYEKVQDRLAELKELGAGVALDDFGTGYSSLQYLTRYPFSKLKIDKSFVWKMESSQKDWEVIRAIVSLGHSLGIQVNAEGAENEKHLQDLRAIGCDSVQGYYHSPPVAEDKLREFLRAL